MTAFAGESMARNRYAFFAKTAKSEGYHQIAQVFMLTADNEKEHAESIWDMVAELDAGKTKELKVSVGAPLPVGDTAANLRSAIDGEDHEFAEMYPRFAEEADSEGLSSVAERLRAIALAEKHHRDRYRAILEQVEKGTFLKKEEEAEWVCLECGYVHTGTEPPQMCPSCHHDRGYFHLKCEKY